PQLSQAQFADRATAVSRPLDGVVVHDDEFAVQALLYVQLHRGGAQLHGSTERRYCILGRNRSCAAVGNYPGFHSAVVTSALSRSQSPMVPTAMVRAMSARPGMTLIHQAVFR